MKWLARIAAVLTLGLMLGAAVPQTVSAAFDPLQASCDSPSADQSSTCTRSPAANPLTGTNGLIFRIANIVAVIAGIAAVIILILAGISYITAGGDAQKIASAKNMIIGAIIGLIVIALAQVLVTFIVKGAL